MQYLLTQEEYTSLQNSNPNMEKLLLILEAIKVNPYSDQVRAEFLRNVTRDLINVKPQDFPKVLKEWEEIIFPR